MNPMKNEDLHYIDLIKLQYERIALVSEAYI